LLGLGCNVQTNRGRKTPHDPPLLPVHQQSHIHSTFARPVAPNNPKYTAPYRIYRAGMQSCWFLTNPNLRHSTQGPEVEGLGVPHSSLPRDRKVKTPETKSLPQGTRSALPSSSRRPYQANLDISHLFTDKQNITSCLCLSARVSKRKVSEPRNEQFALPLAHTSAPSPTIHTPPPEVRFW
jgi:hypothetical protein